MVAVDTRPQRRSARSAEPRRQVVGEHRLAGAVDAVHRHDPRPVRGQREDILGEPVEERPSSRCDEPRPSWQFVTSHGL
jgi:hypothetical protein